MTRFLLLELIQKEFPAAEKKEILRLASELEQRLFQEILEPAGLSMPAYDPNDMQAPLLASSGHSTLYLAYLSAHFAMQEEDFIRANAFAALFEQTFSELAVAIRRTHMPAQNNRLAGGDLF